MRRAVDLPIPPKARAALELGLGLDYLMGDQVCDAALDGALECSNETPCTFHRQLSDGVTLHSR